jgi:hypothetical protein
MPELHKRNSDNMEHPHERISDPILVDLLSTMKANNIKIDTVVTDISELRKNQDSLKDRLSKVESGNVALATRVEENIEYVKQHAKEEEKILSEHVEKMKTFEESIGHIKRGFPKNDDGERDPRSHADDHEKETVKKKDYAQLLNEIKKWAIIAILSSIAGGVIFLIASGSKVELKRAVSETTSEVKGK